MKKFDAIIIDQDSWVSELIPTMLGEMRPATDALTRDHTEKNPDLPSVLSAAQNP